MHNTTTAKKTTLKKNYNKNTHTQNVKKNVILQSTSVPTTDSKTAVPICIIPMRAVNLYINALHTKKAKPTCCYNTAASSIIM